MALTPKKRGAAGGAIVKIKLKMGTGRLPLQGFEYMHDHVGDYDANKSWEMNLINHFGVSLDPTKYVVRRYETNATKHELTDKVRDLVNEFKQVRKVFTVSVIEVVAPSKKTAAAAASAAPVPKAQHGKIKIPISKRGVKKEVSPPPSSSESNATAPITKRTGTPTLQRRGVARISPPVLSPQPQVAPTAAVSTPVGRKRPGPAQHTAVPRLRLRLDGNGLPPDEEFARNLPDVEDDAMSQASQSSQDELAEMGIPYDDIRTEFVRRAMGKFSNGHLLEVKQELLQSKNTLGGRRWMKWLRLNPLSSGLVRELLDI